MISGANKDLETHQRIARASTSRKQLHFAPLQPMQLGRVSEQPHELHARSKGEDLLSPGRSKSVGSAVDRALLKEALDAELAVAKDRPRSAQFSTKVCL